MVAEASEPAHGQEKVKEEAHTHSLQGLCCFNAGMVSTSDCANMTKMQEYEEVPEEPMEDPKVKDCDKDTAALLRKHQ